ncbi:putative chromatin regulator PHD family [Helianthus annuus]|nr:putative chromatin regulator PHD family [Helianthus annuus]
MVFAWRRAFCTSVPREPDADSTRKPAKHKNDQDQDQDHDHSGKCNTPKFGSRFVFFSSSSNPSTPRLHSHTDSSPNLRCRTRTSSTNRTTVQEKSASVPVSPKLRCKTSNSPKLFQWSSTPSSPRSPSTFSLLKSNLRLSTNRCGLCLQSVKSGRGVAIFTAECSHSFHFPCIAGYVKEKGSLTCPVCGTMRKETPVFSVTDRNQKLAEEDTMRENDDDVVVKKSKLNKQNSFRPDLKVYDDDEPIGSLTPKGGFNPIPESDESFDEDSIDEFQGFHINNNYCSNNSPVQSHAKEVDVRLLPEAAVISASRGYETYAICLRAKAPPMRTKTERRAPIDLVTVIDEEREMLIELKVPSSAVGVHTVLSVRCSYRESESQNVIYCNEHALVVPRPHTVRSSSVAIQRLRNLFITTRALAESRALTARNDLIGAYHTLISARVVLSQTSSGCSEFVVSVEAELNELQRRRQAQAQVQTRRVETGESEPLTPISAWRVAEKLAKVAMMRKTLNRVSDLHGFEDARF